MQSAAASAETSDSRFEELEQKVKALERQLEIRQEETDKKAKESPNIKVSDKGLGFETRDGNYQFKINGLFQGDARFFLEGQDFDPIASRKDSEDTFLLRRVRPTLQGQLGKLVAFRLTPEFAGDSTTVLDAYVDLKFSPAATLRVGKAKVPVGLERYHYSTAALPLAEFGLPTELAPNRDLGITLQGEVLDNRLSYAVGVYNGGPDGRDAASSDADDNPEVAGRIFAQPFINDANSSLQGLGFGIGASRGKKETDLAAANTGVTNNFLSRYRSPGQEQIFGYRDSGANFVQPNGDHTRFTPQFYYYRNAFGLLGEYITSEQAVANVTQQADLEHTAWQLTASYVLTGEDASFKGVSRPDQAFDWSTGSLGAFEVVARVGGLEIDDRAFDDTTGASFADATRSVSEVKSSGLGLNWYLTSNTKAVFSYYDTAYTGGAGVTAAPEDRDNEKLFITRLQYQF